MSEILLADIGGTHARFALLTDAGIGPIAEIDVAASANFETALAWYLERANSVPRNAALAVAGPVGAGPVRLTNSDWIIDAAAVEKRFGFARVRLVNDFAATAWAVPRLDAGAVRQIGGGTLEPTAPAAVLGPGTGLGVAAYLPGDPGRVIVGEGGHATLAVAADREDQIVARLRARFGHVSVERVLSGAGLVNLYEAIAAVDGATVPARSAEEVSTAALDDVCSTCREALALFCAMLGAVAGDLALILGARGGVYVAGGIAPQILDFLAASHFRARFEAKGRMADYVAAIPTYGVVHPHPTFVGLAELMRRNGA